MSAWTIPPRNGREWKLFAAGRPEPRHRERVRMPPCLRCGGRRFSLKPNRRLRRGLQRYCLDCAAVHHNRWRAANRERYLEAKRVSQRRLRAQRREARGFDQVLLETAGAW